jgi:transcriptional regulator with XRE-family HTH domain
MKKKDVHIGSLIQERLKYTGKTVLWLADKMGYSRTAIYKIFKSKTIDTSVLMRFCKILKFDFFIYYIEWFNENEVESFNEGVN